jgi:hypothetical protein
MIEPKRTSGFGLKFRVYPRLLSGLKAELNETEAQSARANASKFSSAIF